MPLGISSNIKYNSPLYSAQTFVGTVTVNAGATVEVQNLPALIQGAVKAAAAAVPQAAPTIPAPYNCMQILGAATGLVLSHNIAGYTGGYPIPHVPAAGGAHPQGLFIPLGDFGNQSVASKLCIVNPTAGNIDLHVIVWGE